MNYAKSQPDLAILAVNTFVKDAENRNPLIKALAIRSMGCIRVDKITEYLCGPLAKCLKDQDPYVRKTAAICVAKLYETDPNLVETKGFLDDLRNLLADSNPLVVANAVAALVEIDEVSPTPVFNITRGVLGKLVAALEESSEWAQCYILNSLARYTPRDSREAKTIIDKVLPVLQHANSAVVMGAVRIIMVYLDHIDNKEYAKILIQKLRPPLISMLNREPEVKYVALRNISLILQKRSSILSNEIEVFYCKYRDPIYVKMEKLEIIVMLVNERNIDQVLLEFKEYSQNTDVEFVRKVVRTVGRTAISLDKAADKCVHLLLDLIKTSKVSHVIEESITVLKDIFRRYPTQYENLVPSLVEQGESIEDADARASLVWIIGEYIHQLPDPAEFLQPYLDRFTDDAPLVQQQVLTTAVKLFLKRPSDPVAKEIVENVLELATNEVENPDIRDRGFVYSRLLSFAPGSAKQVVLAERPMIVDNSTALEEKTLGELISNISTLASIYHKPPSHFIPRMKVSEGRVATVSGEKRTKKTKDTPKASAVPGGPLLTNSNSSNGAPGGPLDILGLNTSASSQPIFNLTSNYAGPLKPALQISYPADSSPACKGLQVETMFVMHQDQVKLRILVTNQSPTLLDSFMIKFKPNIYSAVPASTQVGIAPVQPGAQGRASVTVAFSNGERTADTNIPIALRCGLGMAVFNLALPFQTTLLPASGKLDTTTFAAAWQQAKNEVYFELEGITSDQSTINHRLEENNIFFVTSAEKEGSSFIYHSAKMADGSLILTELELSLPPRLCVNSLPAYSKLVSQTFREILG